MVLSRLESAHAQYTKARIYMNWKNIIKDIGYRSLNLLSMVVGGVLISTTWQGYRKIRNVPLIKSMGVWLVIVPISAKFLSNLSSPTEITFLGHTFQAVTELPFSWQTFFFSALCFSIANLIYMIFAPTIVKDYKDFSDFLNSGKGEKQLKEYLGGLPKDRLEHVERLRKLTGIERKIDPEEENRNLFWDTYDVESFGNLPVRFIVLLFYALGIILLTDVIIKNIEWVLSAIDLNDYIDNLFFGEQLKWLIQKF